VKKVSPFFVGMNDQDLIYIYTRLLHRYQDDLYQVFEFINKKFSDINNFLANVDCSSDFHSNLENLTNLVFTEIKRRKLADPVLNPL